jgi:hypothetical protein
MRVIYLNIRGASIILTPKPHRAIKGSHGTPVLNCRDIRAEAVNAKTG